MDKNFFINKTLLITGGTGSFGKAFINYLLKKKLSFKKIIIFSRDELKQFEMSEEIDAKKKKSFRFILGDIRDKDKLRFSFRDVDIVIHAAALKQVPASEYNPFEFIKTNILGTQNIIEACLDLNVRKVVALSTDKAAAPINLYGASKLCSDKLFISADNIKGKRNINFSIVRYGNVAESRGSVIPIFRSFINKNYFPITNERMTRFWINLDQAIEMVLWAIKNSRGGEIFVPKIPSFKIIDLAKAINPKAKIKIIGTRPGEKIHEDLITRSDSNYTYDFGKYYGILNHSTTPKNKNYVIKNIKKVPADFYYSSFSNPIFLNVNEIKKRLLIP